MPADHHETTVAGEWVAKAESDLKAASHLLKLGKECPLESVGFHAQQAVEKYLKALLVAHRIPFPKTHDIEKVVRLLPHSVMATWPVSQQRRLTAYATVMRYPGSYEPITLSEARQAVRIARRVRAEIRKLLPKMALR